MIIDLLQMTTVARSHQHQPPNPRRIAVVAHATEQQPPQDHLLPTLDRRQDGSDKENISLSSADKAGVPTSMQTLFTRFQ